MPYTSDKMAGYMRERRAAAKAIEVPRLSVKRYAARVRRESRPCIWLRHYWPHIYSKPFSEAHRTIIAKSQVAFRQGGRYAVAMRRGGGKTCTVEGVALLSVVSGWLPFLLLAAKTGGDAAVMIDDIHKMICGEKFAEDYPEIAYPLVLSQGVWNTLRSYTDSETSKKIGADKRKEFIRLPVLPIRLEDGTERPSPCSGAILWATGLHGNSLRGVHYSTEDGHYLRPHGALCDDPQTDESAKSDTQTEERYRLLCQTIAGTAGRGERIGMVVPCTIIRPGDLASRILDREQSPEFRGDVFPALKTLPGEEALKLWEGEYKDQRQQGIEEEDAGKRAKTFYRAHRAALDDGAAATDPRDVTRGCASAVQSAMDVYLQDSRLFWCEWQNMPEMVQADSSMYRLTPEKVMSHAVNLAELAVPPRMSVLVGHIDINRVGLHWCLCAFAQGQTAHIPAYGRFPPSGDLYAENATEVDRRAAIFAGLTAVTARISELHVLRGGARMQPQLILVDRGFEPGVVHQFCQTARRPFACVPDWGQDASKYRIRDAKLVGKPAEGAHMEDGRFGQFYYHNSDVMKETAQRAFLGLPGNPGGCTLYSSKAQEHRRFAEHVCNEWLKNKYETSSGMRWEWGVMPGQHDWLDNLAGCYAAAAIRGISANGSGQALRSARPPQRRSKIKPQD